MKAAVLVIILIMSLRLSAQKNGLTAEYFNDTELRTKVLTRVEKKTYLNHLSKSPAPGVKKEFYSVRWSGQFFTDVEGEYNFFFTANDGIRVWIDGNIIVDAWYEQEATTYKSTLFMESKSYHDIKIEYFNTILHSVMMVAWENPEDEYIFMGSTRMQPRVPLPTKYLYATKVRHIKKVDSVMTRVSEKISQKTPTARKASTKRTRPASDSSYALNTNVILESVHFEQSKHELNADAHDELNKIVRHLAANPDINIKIIGHTDYAGDSLANMNLSAHRANAVAEYLLSRGVAKTRVEAVSMGSQSPIVFNDNIANRSKNRRVEFVLTND